MRRRQTRRRSARAAVAPARSEDVAGPVREQVENRLRIDPGMAGLEDFIVVIEVVMNPDGSVQSAKIDSSRDNGNPNWRVFAEQCLRAILRASPLKMPNKPYEAWKNLTLVFHGRDMANL
jgi:hypothetical protein